jgi:rare lipoprotein A
MTPSEMPLRRLAFVVVPVVVLAISGCAARSKKAATTAGILEAREGLASYYGPGFDGKVTASGTRFDMKSMVAAHPSYPFGTVVRVTNMTNGRAVELRVVDRGPARGPQADGVIIDVSYGAASALNFLRAGRTRVRIDVLRWGD